MRRNNVYGRLLSIVLAATLALSPATTSLAASVEDTGLYGATLEDGAKESDEEIIDEADGDALSEDETDEAASGNTAEDEEKQLSDDSETGSSEEDSDEPLVDDEKDLVEDEKDLVEDEKESEEAEEASSLESSEDAAKLSSKDAAAKASSDEDAESKLLSESALMGAGSAPSQFPSGAKAQGDPKEVGVNVLGQLYTWTAADGKHTGLYIYGDGTTINKPIWSVFNTEYKTITDLEFWPDVLGIEGSAFQNCEKLSSVTLPEGLQTIGYRSFANTSLKEITIPSSVISMGGCIFEDCTNLATVSFADGMTVIPANALQVSSKTGYVRTVNIPSTVTEIGRSAFLNQSSLQTVKFNGAEVTVIGDNAFYYCSALQSIELPATLIKIDSYAFEGCGLTGITLPEDLQSIGYRAFVGNTYLNEITIPASVISMGANIFDDCTSLTEVSFAEGMTVIPANAFQAGSGHGHVKTVNIPSTATEIGENAFYNQSSLQTVNFIGEQLTVIGSSAFGYCSALKHIDLPASLAKIGQSVFEKCGLTEITLPDELQSIGYRAFAEDASIREVTIPASVISMGSAIFDGCAALATVSFAEGMTVIPENALRAGGNSGYVRTVKIPSTATEIGEYAFSNQNSLQTVNFNGAKVTEIGNSAFYSCSALKSIDLPATLEKIDSNAFKECGLTGITLPEGLQSIGYNAFAQNAAIKEVTIPSSVISMGANIFDDCSALATVSFAKGMTVIPENALQVNSGSGYVKTVNIPSTVTEIRRCAFYNQNSLQTVNFNGAVIEKIGGSAFYRCAALKTIDLSSSKIKTIFSYTFEECAGLTSIDLPATLEKVEWNAFYGCTLLKEVFYTGTEASRNKIKFDSGNDPLINATWKYLKPVTGVSLDETSFVFYKEDIKAGKKIELTATVVPANASHLEVYAASDDQTGNAVQSVAVGKAKDNTWPITVTLTGEVGKSVVTVTTKEGGYKATCNIIVKEKETARTPVFYLNGSRVSGKVEMTEGDRLTVGGLTPGAQVFWGTTKSGCNTKFADALVGGKDISSSATVYVVSKKTNYKDSAVTSITVNYTTDTWGDVTDEDRAGLKEVPEGVWIPERFLTETGLIYTGAKLTLKEFNVYYGNKLLTSGKDYSVSYKNNINAAARDASNAPAVTVTLKGNYGKATKDFNFNIATKEIGEAAYTRVMLAETRDKAGNLKELKPDLKLKVDGRALKIGTDYKVTYYKAGVDGIYGAIAEEGVYDVLVVGIGNYAGSVKFERAIQVSGADTIKISALTLSKPANVHIPVGWNGDQDIFKQNITASYKGNNIDEMAIRVVMPIITKPGKYTLTVEGTGHNFELDGKKYCVVGNKALSFTVTGSAAMKNVQVTLPTTQVTYSPEGNRIDGYVLKYENKTLNEGTDYSVAFANDTKAGTATITFTGLGAFTGSVKKTYKINKADISAAKVLNEAGAVWVSTSESYSYTKGGTKPVVTLKDIPETAYSVAYSNNKAVAAFTAGSKKNPSIKLTGKGNYTGTVTVGFSITKSDIAGLSMTVNNLLANASPKKYAQTPVITDSNGTKLVAGTDFDKKFEYTYAGDVTVTQKVGSGKKATTKSVMRSAGDPVDDKDIIPAGAMIRMTVNGKGNYTGGISEVYEIANNKISALKFEIGSFSYTGKAVRPGKSNITVKTKSGNSWVVLGDGSEYYDIVSYKNNVNKGTATVTIKGKNGFAGKANVTFKIVAK